MKNKNVLIAVIGAIVACIVCAGIVFLYPKSENNLKGNETQTGYEEEISLGDTGYCSPQSAVPSSVCSGLSEAACDANSACYWVDTTPTSSPTSTPVATQATKTCYKFENNTCTQTTVSGTTCNTANGYYSDWASCRSNIVCGSNQYLNGNSCVSCGAGYQVISSNCQSSSASTCCVSTSVSCASISDSSHCLARDDCQWSYSPSGTCSSKSSATSTPATTSTPVATPNNTVGCCYKVPGSSQWYFESNEDYCSDMGAGYGDTYSECMGRNATPTPTTTTTTSPTATATATTSPTSTASRPCCSTCGGNTFCLANCVECATPTPTATTTTKPTTSATTTPTGGWTCSHGHHNEDGNKFCTVCGEAKGGTTTSSPTATTQRSCDSISGSSSCLARDDCEWDYTNGCHKKPQTCTTPNTYWNGTECISCPNGFKATATVPSCHMVIPAGSYYNLSAGTTTISSCPAGTYSTGGYYYLSGNNSLSLTNCTSCPSGTTSPIGSKSKSACVAPSGECSMTVTSSATKVSPNTTTCENDNRYPDTWTVTVKITGDGCTGATLVMGGNGAERSGSSGNHTVTNGQTFNFLYHATTCCSTATATATLTKDGKTIASGSKSVETSRGWHLQTSNQCVTVSEYNSNPHSYAEADNAGVDKYYIAKNNTDENCKGNRVVDIYVRGCSGGGSTTYSYCCAKDDGTGFTWYSGQKTRTCPSGYTIDTSKNSNTCKNVLVPACYVDGDDGYHWTTDPEDSWIKVAGVTKETDCKKTETPACYKDPNGEYKWGLYAKTDGYTLITSIATEDKCNSQGACYKNNFDDYQWTTAAPTECINKNSCWVPKSNQDTSGTCKYTTQNACEDVEGYKVVTGATKPEDCAPDERPACYVHGQDFVWGKYANVSGYIKLDDIDAEKYCKVPTDDACYKDPDGNYVWGNFEGETGYKLVPSITSLSQCNNDVPTPSTGLDVSKVVYIFMAILMAFGIGFIYYSSIMKKQNQ